MGHGTFEKLNKTEKTLYGPEKLLLCGFSIRAQATFSAMLELIGLGNVPRIWVLPEQKDTPIRELLALDGGSGSGKGSNMPKAVIVAGIAEKALIALMGACKKSDITGIMWAALTPTSEQWAIDRLLEELAAERKAMQQRK